MPGLTSPCIPEKNASNAARPPAEAPMPTMGKLTDDSVDTVLMGFCVTAAVFTLSLFLAAMMASC